MARSSGTCVSARTARPGLGRHESYGRPPADESGLCHEQAHLGGQQFAEIVRITGARIQRCKLAATDAHSCAGIGVRMGLIATFIYSVDASKNQANNGLKARNLRTHQGDDGGKMLYSAQPTQVPCSPPPNVSAVKVLRTSEAYQALRDGRVWKLLAADLGPVVLAMLNNLFMQEDKVLPGSVLLERLTRDIDALRGQGHILPQAAQAYASEWLGQGWLTRRFPSGASEEVYELTADAATALRLVNSIQRPRTAATESRLANVMQQVIRLAEETDANPQTRLAALIAERERIDQEIAAVQGGGVTTLPEDRAVERAREVIALAQDLAADFRNVRDAFDRLNRELRQSLMENDGSRGDVLEHLFAGVDLIAESDPGRTFTAFWRLLTDGEQSFALMEALDAVTSRGFARRLDVRERRR